MVPGTPVFQKVFASESAQPLQIVAGHVWEPVTKEGAALVAVAAPLERSRWGLSDVVTEALSQCARPVLFMPEQSTRGEAS